MRHPSDAHVYMALVVLAIATALHDGPLEGAVFIGLAGLLYWDRQRETRAAENSDK